MTLNYAKHDEEFYGLFKLVSGEELIAKAIISKQEDLEPAEELIFLSNPVTVEFFTKELDGGKIAKGMGLSNWMQMSDEDFFIIKEKDLISLASLSKQYILMYEAYLTGTPPEALTQKQKKDLEKNMGYLGSINEARMLFEKIYNNPSQP
jgi:hypothetical protein|tara:strand:- start:489 stop:938 length:450 start_codon:yes stop_codon:yes gene_type:complete